MTSLLGIAGAMVGGWAFAAIGMHHTVGFVGSVLGAMLILFVFNLARKE